jgi:hypothetical protein
METSAKTGQGVEEVFANSVSEIEKKIMSGIYDISNDVIL